MRRWTISHLAKEFNLSRSTLLYYDAIGLLKPAERSASGYRLYSEAMVERLRHICAYRETGMPLKEIARLLKCGTPPDAVQKFLRDRLRAINSSILFLRAQQRVVMAMLTGRRDTAKASLCDREVFVETLRKAGLSGEDMRRFHEVFEKSAPTAHQDFLGFLGFSTEEIDRLREQASTLH